MPPRLSCEDAGRIPLPSDPQLSPDGRTVAYVVTVPDPVADREHSALWLCGEDGAPRPLTSGPADTAPRWSPDGRSIAYLSAGAGFPQLHLIPVGGGGPRRLGDLALAGEAPCWAPDGRWVGVIARVQLDGEHARGGGAASAPPLVVDTLDMKADGAGMRGGWREHLVVVPPDGGRPRQLTFGDRSVRCASWSPDGRHLAFIAASGPAPDLALTSAAHVVSADGGAPRSVGPVDRAVSHVGWSPDGELLLLAVTPPLRAGHTQLLTVRRDGTDVRPALTVDRSVRLGSPGYPGGTPAWIGDELVVCLGSGGCVDVHRGAVGGAALQVVGGGIERAVSGFSCAAGRIAMVAATADSPGEVYAGELAGAGQPRRVTSLFADTFPGVELVRPVSRTVTGADGSAIQGWILRAASATGPTPLLLDIHGGPHNAWSPVFDGWHVHHQVLAAAGWTVLLVNSRGSDGYGAEFYDALRGGWGTGDQADFLAAVDDLVAGGLADPRRVAVCGYSYGGYMACWLTAHTDRFAAAVTGGCVSDLRSLVGTSDVGRHLALAELGIGFEEAPDLYDRLSPISAAGRVSTPTLVVHGEADDRCPIGQGEQWFSALRAGGVTAQMVRYPGASHVFPVSGRPSHRADLCARTVDWVRRHVEPSPSRPGPARFLAGLRQALTALLDETGVPGAAVGILRGHEVDVVVAGSADAGTGAAVTEDTLFEIGSNTKVLTATLVMQLVDAGLVELDAPIRHHLPDLRLADAGATRSVTVRHLLAHTSGIDGDWFGPPGPWDDGAIAAFTAGLAGVRLLHPVGATWSYCNAGWVLLGRLIESVTGELYDTALRTRLLAPLGMGDTAQRPSDLAGRRLAVGHLPIGLQGEAVPAPGRRIPPASAPAGSSLASTAADVLAFLRMHLEGGRAPDGTRVLDPGSVAAMQAPQVEVPLPRTFGTQWGLGWSLATIGGHRLIGHGGATVGQVSTVEAVPGLGIGVAVLTNSSQGSIVGQRLVAHILHELAGISLPEPPRPGAGEPPRDLGAYAGTYAARMGRHVVSLVGGQLHCATTMDYTPMGLEPDERQATLRHVEGDIFIVEGSLPVQVIRFLEPDGSGRFGYLHSGRIHPRVDS